MSRRERRSRRRGRSRWGRRIPFGQHPARRTRDYQSAGIVSGVHNREVAYGWRLALLATNTRSAGTLNTSMPRANEYSSVAVSGNTHIPQQRTARGGRGGRSARSSRGWKSNSRGDLLGVGPASLREARPLWTVIGAAWHGYRGCIV